MMDRGKVLCGGGVWAHEPAEGLRGSNYSNVGVGRLKGRPCSGAAGKSARLLKEVFPLDYMWKVVPILPQQMP